MAIDTALKRSSVLMGAYHRMMPSPDGVIDAGDREQVAGIYRGITAEVVVVTGDLVRPYFQMGDPTGYVFEIN